MITTAEDGQTPEEHAEDVQAAEDEERENGDLDESTASSFVSVSRVWCRYGCGCRVDADDGVCPYCQNTGVVISPAENQD
jgi:hypothetical protein